MKLCNSLLPAIVSISIIVCPGHSFGQEKNLTSIEELRAQAEQETSASSIEGSKTDNNDPFINRGIGLQKLNPELSVTGDLLFGVSDQDTLDGGKSDFNFRGLGLHFESYLDPYTRFKAAVPVSSNGAELGEAYITSYGATRNMDITLGKFRQNFGVINRWHKHALDQTDFPLALRRIYGDGGLNQTGLSLDFRLNAEGTTVHKLSFQVTDGDNPFAYGQNTSNKPSALARYSNYRDLSDDRYMEFGFTATAGWNDTWAVNGASRDESLMTNTYAFDFTINDEPSDRMRYRNYEFRTEAYFLDKEILAPDGSGEDSIKAWGFFTSFQKKVSRITELGLRYDYFSPDTKGYDVSAFGNHATNSDNADQWMISPYVTWYKTPFIHYRMEFNHIHNQGVADNENRLMFQVVFAVGPHKHERY